MSDLPYKALWRRELNGGMYGQRADVTTSWTRDGLWRAACLQYQAEETETMLQDALDRDLPAVTVAHFLERFEAECAACHAAFLAEQGGVNAAA